MQAGTGAAARFGRITHLWRCGCRYTLQDWLPDGAEQAAYILHAEDCPMAEGGCWACTDWQDSLDNERFRYCPQGRLDGN